MRLINSNNVHNKILRGTVKWCFSLGSLYLKRGMEWHLGSRKSENLSSGSHSLIFFQSKLPTLRIWSRCLRTQMAWWISKVFWRQTVSISKPLSHVSYPQKSLCQRPWTPYSVIPITVPGLQQPHKTAGGRNETIYSMSTGKQTHNIGNKKRKVLATIWYFEIHSEIKNGSRNTLSWPLAMVKSVPSGPLQIK